MADTFVAKLNKKQDGSSYAVEEAFPTTAGVFEGLLGHDNIFNSGIRVYTGSQFSGDEVLNFIVSIPADTPWKRSIKIFSNAPTVYVTYETPGDIVEADDVNALQTSLVSTQVAVESKAATTYVDTQLLLKADKAVTYTKTETDDRIQTLIGAAPAAMDTLQELADALNNDPNFAATMTTQLAGKVDKVAGKALSTEDYTTAEKTKLAGVEAGANKYLHPANHPPAIITQDVNNRFVTDSEKANWNGKLPSTIPVGQPVLIDTDGASFGRLTSVVGVPDWVGWTLNASYSNGWVLDDPNLNGWLLKMDVRAGATEYAVYLLSAGAGVRPVSDALFRIASNGQIFFGPNEAFHAGNHGNTGDPHSQYALDADKGVANGYAGLDASGKVPAGQLPPNGATGAFTWNQLKGV